MHRSIPASGLHQPEASGARLASDGPNEQSLALSLDSLPDHCCRTVVAAVLDGDGVTFGDVGAVEIEQHLVPRAELSPDPPSTPRPRSEPLLLAEIYLRGDIWRLRAVGQGFTTDLATLARSYGVDVED